MWEIDYSDEVKNYFRGDLPLAFRLMKVLAELMVADDGLPVSNYKDENGLIRWEVADHAIHYNRKIDKKEILIVVIKPL